MQEKEEITVNKIEKKWKNQDLDDRAKRLQVNAEETDSEISITQDYI